MYDLKELMTNAWEIKKKANIIFSKALKMAWNLAKACKKLKEKDYIESGSICITLWMKYGKFRTYIHRDWVSNFQNSKGYHINLETGSLNL